MQKLLVISCHLAGGCFQYSNEIIARIQQPADIYIPKKVAEPTCLKGAKTFLLWGYPSVFRYLSLLGLLIKVFIYGRLGYYKSIIIFGYAGWDYFIMKVWKLTKLPSYFVVHDGKMHNGEVCNKMQKRLVYLMNNATYLIFLSEYVRDMVNKSFGICKPYHIAPHGLIDYGAIETKEQAEIPTLLFLGRVSKYKGIEHLLSAIDKVPKSCYSKLIIAGKWSVDMKVPESSDKIEVINKFLTTDEILDCIKRADIVLLPYLEATQSGVASLALNYLKPSIVTEVGAFKEQFSNKSALFIEPNSSDLLTHAIELLCRNLDMRNEMVQEIKSEREKFKWEQITRNLEEYILSNESANC